MKKLFIATGLSLAFIALASAGFSQTKTRITHRQIHQQHRIKEGVKDGELTRKEAVRLEAREAKIQQNKKEAKADGVVTGKERAKLHRQENRASRAIYKQKHDAQTRG